MPSKLRYLSILDYEATCGEEGKFPLDQMEITEFPTIVYDVQAEKEVGRFHEYVRPVIRPQLTEFCINLTGITQAKVDNAEPFLPVWDRFKGFLKSQNLWDDPSSYAFVTCGEWDFHTMLPRQLSHINSTNPSASSDDRLLVTHFQQRLISIDVAFKEYYGSKADEIKPMLGELGMDFVGRLHSGIDDCENILRIVKRMMDDGWVPEV